METTNISIIRAMCVIYDNATVPSGIRPARWRAIVKHIKREYAYFRDIVSEVSAIRDDERAMP